MNEADAERGRDEQAKVGVGTRKRLPVLSFRMILQSELIFCDSVVISGIFCDSLLLTSANFLMFLQNV